ncbi:MAG: GNAT family acetyltransferase [Butyrivibrio sp.]|nr:GNAT family acetyltransferase [Butyrivibrio sp.]
MKEYIVANILDLLETIGEDKVSFALSEFSCSRNMEIEDFIHNNAIDFAKKKMSITHLIFDEEGQIEAFFTLTHKPSTVGDGLLSKTWQKKLSRHARLEPENHVYSVSAFLIAQFGKNENVRGNEHISGDQLMDFAISVLQSVQRQTGGGVVFLECEDKPGLLEFYQNEHNNFKVYGERFSDSDQTRYIQLLRFF